MSYIFPESSFSMYLLSCFTTVPENVWVSVVAREESSFEPDSGAVVSGVWEGGCCVLGACCDCGVCCGGAVSGVDDGVVCALSTLPQEIIPMTTARVARKEMDCNFFTNPPGANRLGGNPVQVFCHRGTKSDSLQTLGCAARS